MGMGKEKGHRSYKSYRTYKTYTSLQKSVTRRVERKQGRNICRQARPAAKERAAQKRPLSVFALKFHDIRRPKAFRGLLDVEFNRLTFDKDLNPLPVIDVWWTENILTIFFGNEPETLGLVKPLNSSFSHGKHLLS